jgi:hypothetical protein
MPSVRLRQCAYWGAILPSLRAQFARTKLRATQRRAYNARQKPLRSSDKSTILQYLTVSDWAARRRLHNLLRLEILRVALEIGDATLDLVSTRVRRLRLCNDVKFCRYPGSAPRTRSQDQRRPDERFSVSVNGRPPTRTLQGGSIIWCPSLCPRPHRNPSDYVRSTLHRPLKPIPRR